MMCAEFGKDGGTMVNGRFIIGKPIGKGGFSTVFTCFDSDDKFKPCAIKFESYKSKGIKLLEHEKLILSQMKSKAKKNKIEHLFPNLISHGRLETFSYLVMELLGASLKDLIAKNDCNLPSNVKMSIGIELLASIKAIHDLGFIHRDIKPANFLIRHHDVPENDLNSTGIQHPKLILADYGLAFGYLDKNGKHIPFQKNVGTMGTLGYKSLGAHEAFQQSRRDDMHSFVFTLHSLDEPLPWASLKATDFDGSFEELEMGIFEAKKKFMREFSKPTCKNYLHSIVKSILTLNFIDRPDYESFHAVLTDVIKKLNVGSKIEHSTILMEFFESQT